MLLSVCSFIQFGVWNSQLNINPFPEKSDTNEKVVFVLVDGNIPLGLP
jgi:hypothetical protein